MVEDEQRDAVAVAHQAAASVGAAWGISWREVLGAAWRGAQWAERNQNLGVGAMVRKAKWEARKAVADIRRDALPPGIEAATMAVDPLLLDTLEGKNLRLTKSLAELWEEYVGIWSDWPERTQEWMRQYVVEEQSIKQIAKQASVSRATIIMAFKDVAPHVNFKTIGQERRWERKRLEKSGANDSWRTTGYHKQGPSVLQRPSEVWRSFTRDRRLRSHMSAR